MSSDCVAFRIGFILREQRKSRRKPPLEKTHQPQCLLKILQVSTVHGSAQARCSNIILMLCGRYVYTFNGI